MATVLSAKQIEAAICAGHFSQDEINGMIEALKFSQQKCDKEIKRKFHDGDWVLFTDKQGDTIKGFVGLNNRGKNVTVKQIDSRGNAIKHM